MNHHTTHPALSHAPAPGPPAGDSPLPAAAGRLEDRHWSNGLLLLVALLLAVPALLPFFVEGLPRSFDGGTHLLRIGRLIDQIRSGTLFPRWTPELSLGYGYPVFSYYAPATYYLVAALHGLGLSIYHAFVAAFIGLMLVGALGLYRWGCALFGGNRRAALVAAVAYLYSPYLLTNVYIRGAIAEVGALALLPWIFWSARGLMTATRPERYLLPLVLSLGGLAVTHNITLLFTPPVLLGYLAVLWLTGDRRPRRLAWVAGGLLLAAAVSAFFWLPLIAERTFLSDRAYLIARTVWLPRSMWTWSNFLDAGLQFTHTFARPIRFGLVQLGLAGLGLLLAGRRDAEWLYLAAVALGLALFGGVWALPLWTGNDILPIAQFPWRLLSIISLSLALLTGGVAAGMSRLLPNQWTQRALTPLLLLFIIWTHQPRLAWMDLFAAASMDLSAPVAVQLEADSGMESGAAGTSLVHEYRPRWADLTLTLDPATVTDAPTPTVRPLTGNLTDLRVAVSSVAPTTLRFHTFYFPGWTAQLDDAQKLPLYPSTNLGLLTVDLPRGDHVLSVTWTGTGLQRGAGWASLLALLLLALVLWWGRAPRWLLIAPLLCVAVALTAWRISPTQGAIRAPAASLVQEGLQLVGFRTVRADSARLTLYPYWLVTQPPPADLTVDWQLQDQTGRPVALWRARPYFNAVHASNWPVGTLVDDAYDLALPPGLATGDYQLHGRLSPNADTPLDATRADWSPVGRVSLDTATDAVAPSTGPILGRFGDAAQLADVAVSRRGRPLLDDGAPAVGGMVPVVEAGSYVDYTLAWLADGLMTENDHAFVHLVDHQGVPLAQEDHLPGPLFQPPRLWNRYWTRPDVYRLRLPHDAPGGLYWPTVGLYRFNTQKRLPVWPGTADTAAEPGDHLRLEPIKIVQRQGTTPQTTLGVTFDGLAQLRGYDLAPPSTGVQPSTTVRPGESMDLTLHLTASQDGSQNPAVELVRFMQLYHPQLGMAAQFDSPPRSGGNPTWSWRQGETIVDAARLTVAADALPGTYTLYVGFYDRATGRRVPVRGEDGRVLAADWAPLTEIEVIMGEVNE